MSAGRQLGRKRLSDASRGANRLAAIRVLLSQNSVLSSIEKLKYVPNACHHREKKSFGRYIRGKSYSESVNAKQFIAIKDNFVTTDLPTTCASYILDGYLGPTKATVVDILEKAGIVVTAKTNMDEFGMGSHSLNSAYRPVTNGKGHQAQSAGGSSGGSAMVVAEGVFDVAIGSDTGGSVRLPAAYTGTVGFKPSYGRISRNGLVPYANSLDTVGILASNCRDALTVYRLLNHHDPADPTSLSQDSRRRIENTLLRRATSPGKPLPERPQVRLVGDYPEVEAGNRSAGRLPVEKMLDRPLPVRSPYKRIGVPKEYNIDELHPVVRSAWVRTLCSLREKGHTIHEISLPTTQQALGAYYVLAPAEASSNLAKYDGVRYGATRSSETPDNHDGPLYSHYRGTHFGEEVQRRILLGTFSLSAGAIDNYFIRAQRVRRLVQADFNRVFSLAHPLMQGSQNNLHTGVDYIVVPTAPTVPPLISEVQKQSPLNSYINDVFTVPASLAGLPAVSVPVLVDEDSPLAPDMNVGMQVIGQFGDDYATMNFVRHNIEVWQKAKMINAVRTWSRKGSQGIHS